MQKGLREPKDKAMLVGTSFSKIYEANAGKCSYIGITEKSASFASEAIFKLKIPGIRRFLASTVTVLLHV